MGLENKLYDENTRDDKFHELIERQLRVQPYLNELEYMESENIYEDMYQGIYQTYGKEHLADMAGLVMWELAIERYEDKYFKKYDKPLFDGEGIPDIY